MDKNLHFPVRNYYSEGTSATVDSSVSLVDRGTDPKPLVLEFCKPMCLYWKEKLERCEHKLATIIKVIIMFQACIGIEAPMHLTSSCMIITINV